jgi:mannosyltransferase
MNFENKSKVRYPDKEEKSPRVLFDRQILNLQKRGGILTYFRELEASLTSKVTWTNALRCAWAKPDGNTILHHTFYIPFHLSRFSRLPRVITVYDFIPEAGSSLRQRWAHLAKKSYISKADAVIFISEAVRKEAISRGFKPKIHVVAHLASRFSSDAVYDFAKRDLDVLFVGRRGGYKNFSLIPAALSNTVARPKLTIVGGGKLKRSELELLRRYRINFEHFPRVSDLQLKTFYLRAKVMVHPSKTEGFGLTTVEAMSLGCPVIAADNEVCQEVCSDSAILISSGDHLAWARALDQVLNEKALWATLSKKGMDHSKNFSWQDSANLTLGLYQRVLGR